jgi:hypothetical protein
MGVLRRVRVLRCDPDPSTLAAAAAPGTPGATPTPDVQSPAATPARPERVRVPCITAATSIAFAGDEPVVGGAVARGGAAADPRGLAAIGKPMPGDQPAVPDVGAGGMRAQVARVREVVEGPMLRPDAYRALGMRPPRGVLLYGPPGTGAAILALRAPYCVANPSWQARRCWRARWLRPWGHHFLSSMAPTLVRAPVRCPAVAHSAR